MKSGAFTLIELMVVLAIIGIVASIAYPAYEGYMASTYKAQAEADLKTCALSLDRYYSNGFTYVGADTSKVCTLVSPTSGSPHYDISYQSLTKSSYTIRATPVGKSCGTGDCIQLTADGTLTQL